MGLWIGWRWSHVMRTRYRELEWVTFCSSHSPHQSGMSVSFMVGYSKLWLLLWCHLLSCHVCFVACSACVSQWRKYPRDYWRHAWWLEPPLISSETCTRYSHFGDFFMFLSSCNITVQLFLFIYFFVGASFINKISSWSFPFWMQRYCRSTSRLLFPRRPIPVMWLVLPLAACSGGEALSKRYFVRFFDF